MPKPKGKPKAKPRRVERFRLEVDYIGKPSDPREPWSVLRERDWIGGRIESALNPSLVLRLSLKALK